MKKKALLVISFGTSYKETREKTIEAIENKLRETFSEYDFYRAFTSRMIIKKLKNRDGLLVDTPLEALEKINKEGYSEVLCQSLHIINGIEYEMTLKEIEEYKNEFDKIELGKPLLTSEDDYDKAITAIVNNSPKLRDDEALILMGHGTEHLENSAYVRLDYKFKKKGFNNVFVGTVEGFPLIEDVIEHIKEIGIKKIYLMPFMIVAGDHAQNDMAGDEEDSWKSILEDKGYEVEVILKGLGEFEEIRSIFVEHAFNKIKKDKR